jgi:2-polyprenyl-3-methyl-5-hydroxy-6-metoxy-1,4-benzoquinol methylase
MPDTFAPPASGSRSEFADRIEIPPHLKVEPLDGRRVPELGYGHGRFTLLMAHSGAEVLAIDFSREAYEV